jgi:hypothetical protein
MTCGAAGSRPAAPGHQYLGDDRFDLLGRAS